MATSFRPASRKVPNLPLHVGGAALGFVGVGIVCSGVVEWGAGGDDAVAFWLSGLLVSGVGAAAWATTRIPDRLTTASAFTSVATTWILASLGGTVPFIVVGAFPTWDAALFESVSGFTGTGSTVLASIEDASRGVLFWRSMTQWYGGTGMVILAVAILPFLGVGGMDLMRTEAPGPTTDRLAPRVSETAKRLWFVYGLFTLLSVVVLLVVGMSVFDATVHAFTVVSTGGLSPYNNSIAAFDSVAVETALIVLMLIGGASFTLHWRLLQGDRGAYWRSSMFRVYAGTWITFVATLAVVLMWKQDMGLGQSVRDAAFNVTTLLTSTGFGTADFVQWAAVAQLLLFALMISGGMAGSTSGGLKLIRVWVLVHFAWREVLRIRRPRSVLRVRLGREPLDESIVQRVVGFALLYVLFIVVGTLVLSFLGTGLPESAGAAASMMGNMGPALGEAGPAGNFLVYSRPARAVLMIYMFAGRLEIFPIVLGFVALYRRFDDARPHLRARIG